MATSKPAAPRQLNELVRTDGATSPAGAQGISSKYASSFLQDGNVYRSAKFQDKIEFIDRKDRLATFGRVSDFTVRAMVDTAIERGWKSFDVRGTNPVFKSMAYVEGTVRGVEVTGHKPNDKDLQAIDRRQTREAARANPVVQAFAAAKTVKEQNAAIKQYPELTAAFDARNAAQKMVKASGASVEDQTDLMNRVNDKIARAVHEGKPMPQYEVKTQVQLHEVERE